MSFQYYGSVTNKSSKPTGTSISTTVIACAVCTIAAVTFDRLLLREHTGMSTSLQVAQYPQVATTRSITVNQPLSPRSPVLRRESSSVFARKAGLVHVPTRVQTPQVNLRQSAAASISSLSLVAVAIAMGFTSFLRRAKPSYVPAPNWNMANVEGMSADELKKLVGYKAVDDHVRSGMVVGLGTGSTAYFAVERVGQKLKSGELQDIVCIPTSVRTKEQAESLGIPLCTLNEKSRLDVSIDGADEVDPAWNLVKGGGGALLREKMVEIVSDKFICIVDESKLCNGLGPGFPLPVEITPFCHEHTLRVVAGLPAIAPHLEKAVLRMGSSSSNKPDGDNIAVTDNGNYIVDLHFKEILKDAPAAAAQLKSTVGVVDHGLFIGMATEVIVAGKAGVYVLPKKG